ncbi:hypothetical protein Anapl_13695 [Anas platyrhynchos]|uniref:Uncharacterized protein n=1 Tax=Anas platyrhynchos TaxID=8839 RepID=R0JB84_ANAPL|nr:hypothetical protein Anapl_13695 [Anas platyrhynchos]
MLTALGCFPIAYEQGTEQANSLPLGSQDDMVKRMLDLSMTDVDAGFDSVQPRKAEMSAKEHRDYSFLCILDYNSKEYKAKAGITY